MMNTPSSENGAQGAMDRDPEALARAIDATREEVDQTLEALKARLSPGQILDRAMALWRSSGGEFASNLGRTVREHPLPILVTGIGMAWMAAVTLRAGPVPAGDSSDADSGLRPRRRAEKAADAGAELRSSLGERLSGVADAVSGAADSTASAAASGAEKISSGLRSAGTTVANQSQRIGQGFSDLLREQPLLVGAVGLALGALVGYALPATQAEDRLMGAARDSAVGRATDAAKEQFSGAAQAIRSAAEDRAAGDADHRAGWQEPTAPNA